MILQPNSLCRGILKHSCRPLTRSRGRTPTGWALGVRSHIRAFSASVQQRVVANQHDDQALRSSCWSVLSSSASIISSSISTSQIQKTSIPLGRIPLLAILLTPAHIGLLNESPEFVPHILQKIFTVHENGQNIDVLAAVVDRIPYPAFGRSAEGTDGQTSAAGVSAGMQVEDGSEGMSFIVLDSNSAAPNLWSTPAVSKDLETMTIQQRCTLSFAFPPTAIPVPAVSHGKERTQPLVSRVLQLPVANTLFKTGQTSTLIAQRWRSQESSGSLRALSCIKEVKLSRQTLHLTDLFSDQSTTLDQSLHSFLTPVTPTRTIRAATGNIIRRILVDHTSNEGAPASEELEKAISVAIKDGLIPAEQAGIWALVRPPNCPSPSQPGNTFGGTGTHEIQEAVLAGCRLHKVLSGGGGWGEKQGLLALDPDSDYHISQQAFGPSYWEDQGVESQKVQVFGELANSGDAVKFYVYRSAQTLGSTGEATPEYVPPTNPISMSLRFGSLPTNMNAMPDAPVDEMDSSSQPSCMVIEHHFGMLSEQGMSLESTFLETDLQASKVRYLVPNLLGQGLPAFNVLDELVLTTKLDAPYMTWCIEEGIKAVDPTNEVQSHEVKSETLEDFVEAMSTMPSHQHVATLVPNPGDRRGVERQGRGDAFSVGSAIGQEVAKLWGRPTKELIRKFEQAGLKLGASSVSLASFGQVQSHIHKWKKTSRERKDALEQLPRHGKNVNQNDKLDSAKSSQQPPDDTTGVTDQEMEARSGRQPERKVHRDLRIRKHAAKLPSVMMQQFSKSVRNKINLGPSFSEMEARSGRQPERKVHRDLRIRKHAAKLPSVMMQQLSKSVRTRIILGPSFSEEVDMVVEGNLAKSDAKDSVQHHDLGAWNAWIGRQSQREDGAESGREASRTPIDPAYTQDTSPLSQSEIVTGSGEQLETPIPGPALDTAPSVQEHLHQYSSRVIHKVSGKREQLIHEYITRFDTERYIDQAALSKVRMAENRTKSLPKRKKKPALMDATRDSPPTKKEYRISQLKKREVKGLGHKQRLPLLNQRSDYIPLL